MKFLTKVVPISKNVKSSFEDCKSWVAGINQGYLYVRYFDHEHNAYACAATATNGYVDLFLESDLIPYEEPKAKEPGKGMFVELTDMADNSPIILNVLSIHTACKYKNGCKIMYKGGFPHINVAESYESIKQLLTDKGLML
jgi:hypothetical protein